MDDLPLLSVAPEFAAVQQHGGVVAGPIHARVGGRTGDGDSIRDDRCYG